MCRIVSVLKYVDLGANITPGLSIYHCYRSVAVGNKNIQMCEMAAGIVKEFCFYDFAKKYKDITACDRIDSSSMLRDGCYEFFKNNQL